MTPADSAGGRPARDDPAPGAPAAGGPASGELAAAGPARRLSPPPPRYVASDEISFDDPVLDPAETGEADAPPPRPTLRHSGPELSDEPTPAEVRVGRPFRLLWWWVAPNSSLLGLVVGAALFSFGMSIGQAVTAALVGTVIAASLLVAGVIEGRRTGVPTDSGARSSFGPIGSRVAGAIALAARVGWGAVVLWLLAAAVGGLVGVPSGVAVLLGVGVAAATVIAASGYRVIAGLQAVVAVGGAILIAFVVIGTVARVDLPVAVGIGDGPDVLALAGAVIIVSIGVLTAVPAAAATGRYQATGRTTMTVVWATIGVVVPLTATVVWGAILAASDPAQAEALLSAPVDGILGLLPAWGRVPLVASVALGLLSALVLAVYSGGFAVQAAGAPIARVPATVLVGIAIGIVSIPLALASLDVEAVLRDLLPTIAVPVVAASAVTAARALTRVMSKRGGRADPRAQPFSLAMLVAAITIGYGLMTADPAWLSWQGYLFAVAGVGLDGEFAASDPGVLVALVVGGLAVFARSSRRRPAPRGSHRIAADRVDRDH